MMKKSYFALLAFLMLFVVSCDEADYEVHQTFFYPQKPYGLQLYADQTADTINVYSIDPWTSSLTGDWFTVSPTVSDKWFNTHIDITTSVNTTGKNRQGMFNVHAHETIGLLVMQNTWLNIMDPSPRVDNTVPFEDRRAVFECRVDDDAYSPEVSFYVYQDDAQLTSQAEWLKPETITFAKGYHTVKVNVETNPEEQERTGTLTLTSAGITSVITIVQDKQVDEEAEQ